MRRASPNPTPGGWFEFDLDGLDQPFLVRIDLRGGRPKIVGLTIDNDREVTAQILRKIRLGAVALEYLADDLEPPVARPEPIPAHRGQAPSPEALSRFAEIHQHNLRRHPRRAVTATASEMGMARTTAYRWISMCHDRGLLGGQP